MTEFEELFHIKELEEVLTGSGRKRDKYSRSAHNIDRKYQNTLLDM